MTKHASISPDGDLKLPKDIVAEEGWEPGTKLVVLHTADGMLIRPAGGSKPARQRISWDEFRRRVPPHEGPPLSLEDMDRAMDRAMAERWKAKEARSR